MRYIFEYITTLNSETLLPVPAKVSLDLSEINLVYSNYEWGNRAIIQANGICFVAQESIYEVTKLLENLDRGAYIG